MMRKPLGSVGAAVAAAGFLVGSALSPPAIAQDKSYLPDIKPASPEASVAAKSFKVAPGTKLSLFAAEPLLANPVAFGVDERGRFYVCETFRHHAGVTDNRNHMNWLDADVACRSVDDRVAMYRKFLKPEEFAGFNTEHERIRLIEDTDGDGTADKATVFADGFKDAADGIGAGVLARKGDVYFTCIPEVWKLRDTNGDGVADQRESLSRGYGVHVALLGHDLHGLKMGPDGRLYFSIGDRGLNVTTKEGKHLFAPDCGSVLRCEPDGSNLEIFASGLRNPQEIAFDDHGNWFTCDNNSDGGDKARWINLVEGGESGWRMGYQYLDFPIARGAWRAERVADVLAPGKDRAAYALPPLAHISDGPSGLTHDPGTGLPSKYRDHFFLADFRGSNSNSGIRSFANQPDGASFKLVDAEQFLWSVLATDVDFGTDGALYVTDWVNGWNKPMKGRIWRVASAETDPHAAEVKQVLAAGMAQREVAELVTLLGHVDQRVRLEAQYELADRALIELNKTVPVGGQPTSKLFSQPHPVKPGSGEAIKALETVALAQGSTLLTRIHAIWGLGQAYRQAKPHESSWQTLATLTKDADPEIRAQAVKTLGDLPGFPFFGQVEVGGGTIKVDKVLPPLLKDASPRVRFFAALALGHHGRSDVISLGSSDDSASLIDLLRDNNDQDAYLRHAAVMGLVGIGNVKTLTKALSDPSAAVRLGAVVALRRLGRPEVAQGLADADPKVSTEAGLAIYEGPIDAALPALADVASRRGLAEPLLRRAINAANRVGRAADLKALAEVAARGDVSKSGRVEALAILGVWAAPPGRDRINGLWRPIEGRSSESAGAALLPVVPGILKEGPDDVRVALLKAVADLKLRDAAPAIHTLIAGSVGSASTRAEALKTLNKIDDPRLGEAVGMAIESKDGDVRAEGLKILARLSPERAIPALDRVLRVGSTSEKQKALETLGAADRPEADAVLARVLDEQVQQADPKIALELLAAAGRKSDSTIRDKAAQLVARFPQSGSIAGHYDQLEGGAEDRGRAIFRDNSAVYCVRCHKVNGEGGEVGPELSGIGKKQPRAYLLESIVAPNAAIAQGFESVVVGTTTGQVVTGVLKSEDDKVLRLMTAEAKLIEIPKGEIDERTRGASAMPEELHKKLTPGEIRDLVEYLANLK